jgi:conjugative transfer signal peptidase TraF
MALLASALAVLALGAAEARRDAPRDLVLYNHSPSLPEGFYVRVHTPIARSAIVTVRAVDAAPAAAHARGFDRPDDRFLKRVAAAAGDRVCAEGDAILLNGRPVAQRQARDRAGAALPRWSGCFDLKPSQLFLLGDTPDSFDSRYFGIVDRRAVEGVWRPVL